MRALTKSMRALNKINEGFNQNVKTIYHPVKILRSNGPLRIQLLKVLFVYLGRIKISKVYI